MMMKNDKNFDKNLSEMKGIVANFIMYHGEKYKLIRGKSNIIIYGEEGHHYYDDWQEDGKILIVKWFPERHPKMAYELLHEINVSVHYGGHWDTQKINGNRMIEPIYD